MKKLECIAGGNKKKEEKRKMRFLNGGYWNNGADAGYLAFTYPLFGRKRELISCPKRDIEGLSDRQVRILEGETSWISKRFRL